MQSNNISSSKAVRVIALIDMDCFYVQVHKRQSQRSDPDWVDRPSAVTQYNSWKGGGIIAVDYLARAKGVCRGMRGDEGTRLCPDLHLFQVPCREEKADLSIYRDAGAEVIEVLSKYTSFIERASIDEAYIDLTEEVRQRESDYANWTVAQFMEMFQQGSFVSGFENEDATAQWIARLLKSKSKGCSSSVSEFAFDCFNDEDDFEEEPMTWLENWRLLIGTCLVQEMRAAVELETSFQCSGGIAHNKVLAKLACGIHKPNKQTLLPQSHVLKLFETIPIKKVRGLGGKFGKDVRSILNVETMGQLLNFTEGDFQQRFGEKSGSWLYQMSRGLDEEAVKDRILAQSIGCSKNFPGVVALDSEEKVLHWLKGLVEEVALRLKQDALQNNRKAKLLTVQIRQYDEKNGSLSQSRCCPLNKLDPACMLASVYRLLQEFNKSAPDGSGKWFPLVTFLGVNASKFITNSSDSKNGTANIVEMFSRVREKQQLEENTPKEDCPSVSSRKSNESTTNEIAPVIISKPSKSVEAKVKPTGALDKFLTNTPAAVVSECFQKCIECGKLISPEDVEEHNDFHLAQKMQQEWNKNEIGTTSATPNRTVNKSALDCKKSTAKKRKSTNNAPVGKTQSILKHFKKI